MVQTSKEEKGPKESQVRRGTTLCYISMPTLSLIVTPFFFFFLSTTTLSFPIPLVHFLFSIDPNPKGPLWF